MKYKIEFSLQASKSLKKMDRSVSKNITNWIIKNLYNSDNPRLLGKPLKGNARGLWRYRIGDYRLIAEIEDDKFIVILIDVDHRRKVYKYF